MKNIYLKSFLPALLFIFLLQSCASSDTSTANNNEIDVASAMSKIEEINLADYFKNIRYISLETTEEGLIGGYSKIQLIEDKILVSTSQKQSLLFDRNGKFLHSIGHIGQDPEAYDNVYGWYDNYSKLIYYKGAGNSLVAYNLDGQFVKRIHIEEEELGMFMNYSAISEDIFVGYYQNMDGDASNKLLFFDAEGKTQEIIPNERYSPEFQIQNISMWMGDKAIERYGAAGATGVMFLEEHQDDLEKAYVIYMTSPAVWQKGKETYFRESFNDTIYQFNGTSFVPYLNFALGEYHWPYEDRYLKSKDKNIYINQVLDGKDILYFSFVTGIYSGEKAKPYNGIYNKKTGKTVVNLQSKHLTDNINHFLSLQPVAVSSNGTFAAILQPEEIMEWFEENGDTDLPAEIRKLKNIREDDNPVLVLMD